MSYDSFVEMAQTMIREDGGPAVVRRVSNSGSARSPVQANIDTDVIAFRSEEYERDAAGTLTGRLVEDLLISTEAGIVPEKGDKVAFGFSIEDAPTDSDFAEVDFVKRLSPDGTDILFTLRIIK
ncbi:MAG: hypothetical protein JXR13_15100 [Thalassovita sp.]